MVVYRSLKICSNNLYETIVFGEAITNEELQEVYRFRYDVYSDKDYIDKDKYSYGIEKDEYDEQRFCRYFVAKINERLIGTIRIITCDPLPTEYSFSFEEPEIMKSIDRKSVV